MIKHVAAPHQAFLVVQGFLAVLLVVGLLLLNYWLQTWRANQRLSAKPFSFLSQLLNHKTKNDARLNV